MKNNFRKRIFRFLSFLAMGGLTSCSAISTPIAPTIAPTPIPVSQGLVLTSTTISETSASPVYTLTALVPQLTGSNDPGVLQFNQQSEILVYQEVDSFRQS